MASLIVLGLMEVVSGLSGLFGDGEEPAWKERPEPNAVLMLVSLRDVRALPVQLLAERVGSDPVSLYVIGASVRVDRSADGIVLRARSNAVLATLRPVKGDASRVVVDGPGLDGPTYAVMR